MCFKRLSLSRLVVTHYRGGKPVVGKQMLFRAVFTYEVIYAITQSVE